jgi:3'-5' exoribonuclease
MKKDKFIRDLRNSVNEKIASVFIVSKIILKQAKSRKAGSADEAYCLLKLQDKSGLIDAIIWPDVYRKFKKILDPESETSGDKESQDAGSSAELKDEKLKEEDCVEVEGVISEYRGDLQIVISSIKKADSGGIDYSYFIRSLPEGNKQNLVLELEEIIGLVENKFLKSLLGLFFKDKKIFEDFNKSAAAVKYHHAYSGGLIEHSVKVAKNCIMVSGNYPDLNKDLLIAGALLHDIGKIEEYYTGLTIKITDEGNLLGHIAMGYGMVREKVKEIEGFPDKTAKELLHIIISHHGYKEFGSPRVPETPEAFVVYHMDHLDADIFHDKFETEGETAVGIENSGNGSDDVPTHILKKSKSNGGPSERLRQDGLF